MSIFIAVIVFLFCLFVLSRDDFVLLRRNVVPQTIFDISFFVGLSGLFFSRLFYVVTHFSSAFLNPFVFFIVPYFPGLTATGLIFGGCLALYLIAMNKKYPLGKLFDIFSLSFLSASSIYFLFQAGQELYRRDFFQAGSLSATALVLFVLFSFIKNITNRFSWKDGSTALVCLFIVTGFFLFAQFIALKFRSLPVDISFSVALFFLFFLSFLIASFRKTRN